MDIKQIIEKLTLEEKAALLQGWSTWTTREIKHLGISAMFLSDGPHGLRKQAEKGDHLGMGASVKATCFPTAATMANSWDPALGELLGQALGEEAAASHVHMVLGPGLNIKRSPLCGRNFEYFSEDPYLAGKMAAAYIRGIQKCGVVACPKHFAANSQELRRMSMDSVVDERALREIYLTGFEIAVKEGMPRAIMSSYNMVNGTYANENSHLLKEILRDGWGFDGMVVTDWGGDNDHTAGVKAGSNLVMPAPGANLARSLVQAVRSSELEESVLDARLREMLPVILETAEALKDAPCSFDEKAHHEIARRCAAQSIVLLENDGILPLTKKSEVALIGDFGAVPRYQGAGSSMVNPTRLTNLLEALTCRGMNLVGYAQGYSRTDPRPQPGMIREAADMAKQAEIVLLCIGLDEISESEGLDRRHLELSPGQQELAEEVCKANANVIFVLSGGAPFRIPRGARAIVHGYLGGQAGSEAMADVLLGDVNPSGKLNETWPLELEDIPCYDYFPSKERTSEYRESVYVGYRYYDTAGVPVRYPFGFGRSYTSFAYSDLTVNEECVSFTLKNVGDRDGSEVVQLYVSAPGKLLFRPKKELKGFAKVFLKAGEEKRVEIGLDDKAFRYFNMKTNAWEQEPGEYTLSVAASAAETKLEGRLIIAGTDAPAPYGTLPDYQTAAVDKITDAEFEVLLGRPIPDGSWSGMLTENDAICQLYYAKSGAARLVYRILKRMNEKTEKRGKPDLNILFLYNMPFRAMARMTGGMVSDEMVADILRMVNGRFWGGLGRLIADFFQNQYKNKKFMRQLEEAEHG